MLINFIISCLLRLKKLCHVMTYLILAWYTCRVILIIFTYSVGFSYGGVLAITFVLTRITCKYVNLFRNRSLIPCAFNISFSPFARFSCNRFVFFYWSFLALIYQHLPKIWCELGEICCQNRSKIMHLLLLIFFN